MKIIEKQDDLQIYYDGKKYTVYYKNQVLLTYLKGYPTLINDDLVIVNEDIINIYQNIRQGLISTSIICKQGIVIAKPMLFNDLIIVVFRKGIVQFDTNLNVLKKLNCEFNGIISQERIVDNMYVFNINNDDKNIEVIYDIENNSIIKKEEICDNCFISSLVLS